MAAGLLYGARCRAGLRRRLQRLTSARLRAAWFRSGRSRGDGGRRAPHRGAGDEALARSRGVCQACGRQPRRHRRRPDRALCRVPLPRDHAPPPHTGRRVAARAAREALGDPGAMRPHVSGPRRSTGALSWTMTAARSLPARATPARSCERALAVQPHAQDAACHADLGRHRARSTSRTERRSRARWARCGSGGGE